ncbi:MAG TPA: hypothetical protein VM344_00410 [Vitreimonas sp.]|nr:hypothetical protein [Vitreimonas sp.]
MRFARGTEGNGSDAPTDEEVVPTAADATSPGGSVAFEHGRGPGTNRFCPDCGHLNSKHERSADDEFAASHGGIGYPSCNEAGNGQSTDRCGCRSAVAFSRAARGVLWPAERPPIATIPSPGAPLTSVCLVSTEVTTTDPINGQPDFEHVEIKYVPDDRLIDSKSLKAYWLWWRGRGASIERLSTLVALDVAQATGAWTVDVTVQETPRGGISIVAAASVRREPAAGNPAEHATHSARP